MHSAIKEEFERAGKRPRFFETNASRIRKRTIREKLIEYFGSIDEVAFDEFSPSDPDALTRSISEFYDFCLSRPETLMPGYDMNSGDLDPVTPQPSSPANQPADITTPTEVHQTSGGGKPSGLVEEPSELLDESNTQCAKVGPASPVSADSSRGIDATRPASITKSTMPEYKYIGSFQADLWATKRGRDIVKFGDDLTFSRNCTTDGGYTADFVIRASTADQRTGFQFARVSEVDARFMAVLMDTGVVLFKGQCIYAEDYLNMGDTIIVEVAAYLYRSAFSVDILDPLSSTIGGKRNFLNEESRASKSEATMRLRQIGLIQLFAKVGLMSADMPDMKKAVETIYSSHGQEQVPVKEEHLDIIYDHSAAKLNLVEAEPSKNLTLTLHGYQKKALSWMLQRENGEALAEDAPVEKLMHPLWKEFKWPEDSASFYMNPNSGELALEMPTLTASNFGGILADEMGLGKTISTLALICTASESLHPKDDVSLVVVPMSLLGQWESEIARAISPGRVKVLSFYGTSVEDLKTFVAANPNTPKIVLTTYGQLVSQHNALKTFCKANGVEVTSSVWQSSLSLSGLFGIEFYRIVLDEAHTIKNRNTQGAKAAFHLRAKKRWALTGTPVVNRLEDLYSLIKFIGLEPWNNFSFWNAFVATPFASKDGASDALRLVQAIVAPVCLRRTKDMKVDGKTLVDLPDKVIEIRRIPFSEDERALYAHMFSRVRDTVRQEISGGTVTKSYLGILGLLIRLRQVCCHPKLLPFNVPNRGQSTIKPAPTMENSIRSESRPESQPEPWLASPPQPDPEHEENGEGSILNLDDSTPEGREMKELLGRFWEGSSETRRLDEERRQLESEFAEELANVECPICSTEPIPAQDVAVLPCHHAACFDCYVNLIDYQKAKGGSPACPMCRAAMDINRIYRVQKSSKAFKLVRNHTGHQSSKTKALINELRNNPGNGKHVVFSQFTTFLDVIGEELERHGYKVLRFDGTMSMAQRSQVLKEFSTFSGDVIFLVSLKSGGVGLNLVAAQQAFLMDPWWSYAIESQAIDRIHRMGQTGNVRIVRFIVEGTIEERILEIQERKKALSLVVTNEEKRADNIENIKTLFDL